MENGLSVEEIVRFESADEEEEEMIQLKGAWALVGEVA